MGQDGMGQDNLQSFKVGPGQLRRERSHPKAVSKRKTPWRGDRVREGPQGKAQWRGESSHNSLGARWGQQVRGDFEWKETQQNASKSRGGRGHQGLPAL